MIRFFCSAAVCIVALTGTAYVLAQPLLPPELPTPPQNAANAEPGYLGMIADDRQENGRGARIVEIVADSPAAQAGLQQGDLITAVDGRPVRTLDDMAEVLQPLAAGAKVMFDVQQQAGAKRVEATLGQRPPPDQRRFQNFGRIPEMPQGEAQSPSGAIPGGLRSVTPPAAGTPARGPLLGVRTVAVTEQTRQRLGLRSTAGAHVVARSLGSPAERANIPLDAVITAIDSTAIGSPGELATHLSRVSPGATVEIAYIANGQPVRSNVTLGPASSRDRPLPGPLEMPSARSDAPNTFSAPRMSPDQNPEGRIQALEQRIRELEERIRVLEGRLQRGT